MKKGILVITVLAAWFLAKNPQYTQLVKKNNLCLSQQTTTFAKTVKQDLFEFTTVHLPVIKIKTNNSKHKTKSCVLQVTNEKQLHNHEPLLIVNGL